MTGVYILYEVFCSQRGGCIIQAIESMFLELNRWWNNHFVHVAFTHSGKEHGEDVDWGFQQVVASDGDGHRRDKHQVTEAEQKGGEQLKTVGVGLWVVRASPALPA